MYFIFCAEIVYVRKKQSEYHKKEFILDIFGNADKQIGKIDSDLSEYQHHVETEPKDVLEEESKKPGFGIFYILLVIFSLILVFRALDLQVVQAAKYQYLAEGNRIRSRTIEAPRGIIYDSQGKILANNSSSFDLEVYPADLPQKKEDREKVYEALAKNSNINIEELKNNIQTKGLYSLEPIVLAKNISRDEALLLKVKYASMAGVEISNRPLRQYDNTITLSHVLGYVGKISQEELAKDSNYKMTDQIGKSGLESFYEEKLKGQDGSEKMEVNSKGQIQRLLSTLEPVAGKDLVLTLDLDLQKKITETLNAMAEKSSKKAVAIAMNPQTGGILAMVSLPGYDNNLFSSVNFNEEYKKLAENVNNPLFNRAISGTYASGSVIKPFIASAGLQENIISENTTINDPGEIKVGEWTFPDWKVHGLVDVRKAIAESCDVFFYAVGGGWDKIKGLGVKKIKEYLEKFGFGAKTGIDLTGEEKGLVPDSDWKKKVKKEAWYIGDTYHLSIGQGDINVTPLQIVNGISAIANGGKLYKPHLLDKVVDSQGNELEKYQSEIISENFIDSNIIRIVQEGMRQTITSGSARSLNDLTDKNGNAVEVTGKTGTAEFGTEDKTHAWFVTYAPFDNPSIAMVILVEGAGGGDEAAVPVAKEILQYYFNR